MTVERTTLDNGVEWLRLANGVIVYMATEGDGVLVTVEGAHGEVHLHVKGDWREGDFPPNPHDEPWFSVLLEETEDADEPKRLDVRKAVHRGPITKNAPLVRRVRGTNNPLYPNGLGETLARGTYGEDLPDD